MPKKGVPISTTCLEISSVSPGIDSSPLLQSPKEPTPGRTMCEAFFSSAAFFETTILKFYPVSFPALSNAFAADLRLPEP